MNSSNKKNEFFNVYRAISVAQWCVLVCSVLTIVSGNLWLGIAEAGLFVILLVLNIFERKHRKSEVKEYMQKLNHDMDSATRESLFNFPFPMVVAHLDGRVSWYNESFEKIIDGETLVDRHISDIIEDLKWSDVLRMQDGISIKVKYNDRKYTVMGNIIAPETKHDNDYQVLLYWLDETELIDLKEKYLNEKTDLSILMIDNYDDVMNSIPDSSRSQLTSLIETKINEWIAPVGGILKKIDRDKYLFMFEHRHLPLLIEGKFEILDWVREINIGNKTPATMSIGIGTGGDSMGVNDEYSRMALDMALGRGGDQAVIKSDNQPKFFGGKTEEHERVTRVKSRVVAHALRQIIAGKQKVVIMGHKFPDADAVGAAVGIARSVINREKEIYIVRTEANATSDEIIRRVMEEPEFENAFIRPDEAVELMGADTLLIVVDTHRPSLVQAPELLKKAGETVIIDHHRRSTEFIENASLVYHEPYASSTCELVAELLQYMDNKVNLTRVEAEAVYAGIYLDTKNFIFKTGVRTFDAASFLRKYGVDPIAIKRLFQIDVGQYNVRADIVCNAEMVRDDVAVSVCEEDLENALILAAQAADELLNIENVTASFVVTKNYEDVYVSARSLGSVNVQVILEMIGGGGHLSVAGAQFKGKSVGEVKTMLTEAINTFFEKDE